MLASSLQVVQVFQERDEWLGPEEVVVMVERREVGCQWESPVEERREVGCQSDSAESRDAGVQVDLLTQQLCGMTWRCVRAGEPGGGALLQHCSMCGTRADTLPNMLLPIMPLRGPAVPSNTHKPETTDHQQATPLPSMPLCEPFPLLPPADATAAPPPGLIAPLSPRLAEEEEEEEKVDVASLKPELSESFHGNMLSRAAEDKRRRGKRKCQQSEGSPVQSRPDGSAHSQRSMRKSDWENMNQSESRRRIRVKTQHVETQQHLWRRNIQTGGFSFTGGGDTTEAEGAEDKTMAEGEKLNDRRRNKRLQKNEVMEKRRRRRRKKEETEGVTPVKIKSELAERPRRKAVGPPIRYLLEYEEWSHSMPVVTKARDTEKEEEQRRRGEVVPRKRTNRRQKMGGGKLHQLHLSIHRAGSRRRGTTVLHLPRLHHHSNRGGCHRNRAGLSGTRGEGRPGGEVKGKRSERRTGKEAPDWTRQKGRVQKNAQRWVILSTMKRRGRRRSLESNRLTMRPRKMSRKEEEHATVEERGGAFEGSLMQRPRRTMVGPPIRYLLESEAQPPQDEAQGTEGVPKPQRKIEAGGGASDDPFMIDRPESTAQTALTNPDRPKHRRGRPKQVRVSGKAGGGASGMSDRDRKVGPVKLVEGGDKAERNKKVKDLPQRLRRMKVGPPIRYLLESERWSHDSEAAKMGKAEGGEWVLKQQKKGEIRGGALADTAMIDRSEDTEQKGTQTSEMDIEEKTELTSRDAVHGPKDWRGRRKKAAEGQTGETQGRGRRRKRCTEGEEVRQVSVNEGGGEKKRRRREGGWKVDKDKKEKQTEPPQRPRRTMVGPPIRYLLESEELSHGREAANQGFGCMNKPQRKNEAEGGAVGDTVMIDRSEDTKPTETEMEVTNPDAAYTPKHGGRPKKVRDYSEAGGGASGIIDGTEAAERQTGERKSDEIKTGERRTGSYLQTALIYFDSLSRQVTILSPCCVRLQRLP